MIVKYATHTTKGKNLRSRSLLPVVKFFVACRRGYCHCHVKINYQILIIDALNFEAIIGTTFPSAKSTYNIS
jgi:hypothetical protein